MDMNKLYCYMEFPSRSAGSLSCDSGFSVLPHSSGSQGLFQPLSPGDNMRGDIPFQACSPDSLEDEVFTEMVYGTAATEDDVTTELFGAASVAERVASPQLAQDLDFYGTLDLNQREEAAENHKNFLCRQFVDGNYPGINTNMEYDKASATPYSDLTQPRKKSRPGSTPKRPMNAFMAFAQRERKNFMTVNASVGNAVISKHLGVVWKSLPDEIKNDFKLFSTSLKNLHAMEFPGYKYKPQKRKVSMSSSAGTPSSDGTASLDGDDAAVPGTPPTAKPASKARKPRSRAKPYSRQKGAQQQQQQPPSPLAATAATLALTRCPQQHPLHQHYTLPLTTTMTTTPFMVKEKVIEVQDLQLVTIPVAESSGILCRISPASSSAAGVSSSATTATPADSPAAFTSASSGSAPSPPVVHQEVQGTELVKMEDIVGNIPTPSLLCSYLDDVLCDDSDLVQGAAEVFEALDFHGDLSFL